ncbi:MULTISPECIES: hypothetical protein [Clostridium]|uniref:DUF4064 domain-containing protein n=1 Tax=Clostridium senegalense TaxID=1465809 RepID=A0A6M0H9M3_9CLOT|nr:MULTISPECIES: hypothetical protein [Clostridium]NEU06342.1 hypothetical protein [Clostridium senegalense]
MENNNVNDMKLGAGIITMSVLTLIGSAFAVLGCVFQILFKDKIQQFSAGIEGAVLDPMTIAISLVMSLILVVSIILILRKKSLGVYIYGTIEIVSLIYNIIMSPENIIWTLVGLIFPLLMGFFIYKKRAIFGFGNKNNNIQA